MYKNEHIKRYLIFLAGLFISSLGVSFVTKAKLGTSPISSISYVLSLGFTPSLGQFTIYFSIFLILLQIFILRKNFKKEQLLQIPVSILFGYFIDMTMAMLFFVNPHTYLLKVISLLCGCVILGFGVYLEVLANVVMLPGEAFVKVLSSTFHTEFGFTKVIFDASMTIIACILSFFLFQNIQGVREGTLIAALAVGVIARFFGRKLSFLDNLLFPFEEGKKNVHTHPFIITITREYGSGGRIIGRQLAEKLQFAFYDRYIIKLTAKESGFSEEYIEQNEQKIKSNLLYDIKTQGYSYEKELPPLDALYEAEKKVIKELAITSNCVIVGRCSDDILREHPHAFHIFIHASNESKIKRIMDSDHLSYEKAKQHMARINKERANYYKRYTGKTWGTAKNYHLALDSGDLSHNQCVELIEKYYEFIKY